ncbi:MAG TPA: protein-L-isoaspartate(D-aspartate) O-methyltransferase [Candidatus Nitrosotalea sp.]|nr:protein-L-isoaspartate(D-aspartate) O-methyltransferase [Candidatus Nitrosotalea sp.]
MDSFAERRVEMVQEQIAARGIVDHAVLEAMRMVPRELFLPASSIEFAYEDTPLPIEEGQTISQPYVVALMAAALTLGPHDRVLEVGAGSGYAAAVLSRIAAEVYAIERHEALAELARRRMEDLGFDNVHVLHGDGTLGWQAQAPYDAIVVAAGGPSVPDALRAQLAIGGRLVIPIGATPRAQQLVRVTRTGGSEYRQEDLGPVQFVPLIGAQGWGEPSSVGESGRARSIAALLRETAESIDGIESVKLDALLDRIGDARIVLLGEATHGSSEFYRMRARITRELIARRGFRAVAVEADWPDAARIDRYVRHLPAASTSGEIAFSRFPTWMWRNREVHEFVEWLRHHNGEVRDPTRHVSFHGLDLYSLYASASAVIGYLDQVDPSAASVARRRYGCLTPWERDPATYGRAALSGRYRTCEGDVIAALRDLLARRLEYGRRDGERFLDAAQNARLVANAERYYRALYYGSTASWNLRDQHMFDTLESLLEFHGPESKIVVWEHNSHVGDAAATEMAARGEHNVGHLCRAAHGDAAYLVGFGTDHGTVAAASEWDAPLEIKDVRPARAQSYERLCHDATVPAFLLALRYPAREAVREELRPPRLERAIGVIYRPESELASHYFQASLPGQFDEYVWFDQTAAVTPLGGARRPGMPETYPFGV